jgi:hypothetical protein
MKKIILVLLAFTALQINAQSFYKGALVADLAYGFDIYSVKSHQAYKYNPPAPHDTTDGAASTAPSLGLEYGVLNWLGIGIRGKYDTYVTSKDKTTGIKPTANGGEIGLTVNFHAVRKDVFNLVGGFDVGYSNFVYRSNDIVGTEAYGGGSWFNIHITPRFYFGRFGISTSINIPFINYPSLTTSNHNINNYITEWSWKATGFGMNFGIQYRFFKEK